MVSPQVEAELASAARKGDQAALGGLLMLHQPRLVRHIAAQIPPLAARVVSAEDIVQQTLLDAFCDYKKFDDRGLGSMFAWLKAIAQHRLQNCLREMNAKKRGGVRRQSASPVERASAFALLVEELAGDQATASRIASRREAVRAVRVALEQLPRDYRRVICLRFIAGYDVARTAQAMERSPGAIRGLTDRAKAELRAMLGGSSLYQLN